MDTLKQQLADLEAQKARLLEVHPPDQEQISKLNEQINELQAQIDFMQSQQLTQTQQEYTGSLKEVLFQVFESVLPKEVGEKSLGLTEYSELSQLYRQMVDLAVDESNQTLYAIVGEQLESKDAKVREVTAKNIDLDTKLQESIRKEQSAQDNYNRALSENERIEHENVRLANVAADKDVELAELTKQIEAKDAQIEKLTEELNKLPVANGIILTAQTKPSQSLSDMMNAAKEKAVKSQLDLALSGQTFRGKVELTPPSMGVSDTQDSFRNEDTTVIPPSSWVPDTETITPPAVPSFPEISETHNTVEGQSANGTVETETVEQRIAALELAVFGKAKGEAA